MKSIGFIGTGVMGSAVVKHLLAADYPVNVYNRTQAKTDELVKLGAVWQASPQKVAETSEIIFTMVGFPADVETTYYGDAGIFSAPVANKVLIDMTTSTPTLAEKLYHRAKELGAASLDAPVSGGDLGAQNGTLTTMVGGDAAVYDQVEDLLSIFSATVKRQGDAGAGQHTKMANQIMIAGTMTGMTELLVYAQKAQLDLDTVMATVGGGSAANWSLANYGPRILAENYSPGFFVKHFIKDLKIALDEADKMGLDLPATTRACELYERLSEAGFENDGTQALIKLWWPSGAPEN